MDFMKSVIVVGCRWVFRLHDIYEVCNCYSFIGFMNTGIHGFHEGWLAGVFW